MTTSLRNPFLIRTAEQSESDDQFLSLFSETVLDLLPEDGSWNRLQEILSAPGGGKSTLLRLFTPKVLSRITSSRHQPEFAQLVSRLRRLDAIDNDNVQLLGVLVNCKEDYNRLAYLDLEEETELRRLFWCLLHSRLALLTIRAALQLTEHNYPQDVSVLRLEPRPDEVVRRPDARTIVGEELFQSARKAEQIIVDSLNSLVPGPPSLDENLKVDDFFQLLNTHRIVIDGEIAPKHILLMFDDAHLLDDWQRELLLKELERHDQCAFASWVAMRLRALAAPSIISEEVRPNREGFEPIQLDDLETKKQRIEPWLIDIAERRISRAQPAFASFSASLGDSLETELDSKILRAAADSERVLTQEIARPYGELYTDWLRGREIEVSSLSPFEQAVRWSQLQIIMQRRIQRQQQSQQGEFTLVPISYDQIANTANDTLQMATIYMSERNGLPYYFGVRQIAQLGSGNVDQFLSLAAAFYNLMLNTGRLGRNRRQLPPSDQHRLILEESHKYLSELHSRVPYGQDVADIVKGIAELSQKETRRPTVPITPCVTGISIQNSDRDALIAAAKVPDSDERRVLNALASAVAHNVLSLRTTRRQSDEDRTVFYLNRLVCPALNLPLGFGGYKTRKVPEIMRWLDASYTEQLVFDIGGQL